MKILLIIIILLLSNNEPDNTIIKQSNIYFGKPGCDNKISFIFTQNEYKCYNVPWNVKTYHYHKTQIRNYSSKDRVKPPYLMIKPVE